ncbi:hypothetical protein [Parafrankia elaeagni]|uniref:hypothetical protein n=1 Tax=Parafrankia elaeagni TaxID=222534 RepID=UPI0003634EF4|nr:hypothetical protein [Parafrankia elaeagni]
MTAERIPAGPDPLRVRVVIGPLDQTLAAQDGIAAEHLLAIRAVTYPEGRGLSQGPDLIELGWVRDGVFQALAAVDGRYLSTEVASGFTGQVVGVEAVGNTDATLARFAYQAIGSS